MHAAAHSLCAGEITDESRRAFIRQVQAEAVQPLKSHFTAGDIIPLGDGTWVPSVPPWTEYPGALALFAEGGNLFFYT